LPIPRDVLARAVSAVECNCAASNDVGVRIFTEPQARVDLGFAETPFELWDQEPRLAT